MARKLEERGIATCCFAVDEDYINIATPPRYLYVDNGRQGYPLGEPGDLAAQQRWVEAALHKLSDDRPVR